MADSRMTDICIISPSYLSASPRPVKEADALCAAGFDVRVVFVQGPLMDWRAHDSELQAVAPWRSDAVRFSRSQSTERALWLKSAIRQRAFRLLPSATWASGLFAERAEGRLFSEVVSLACAEPARLYIGHLPYGLAAAARAASLTGGSLAFDAEDFHSGQGGAAGEDDRASFLQRRYLPHCAHITAASWGIASALVQHFGVAMPVPIHNTFPWTDRQSMDGEIKDRKGTGLSLYWYSQTVGLDRGIQDAIRAMGELSKSVQLHIRGVVSDDVRGTLQQLVNECDVHGQVHFHPAVSPNELLSRAAEHDVGLALEQPVSLNRQIAATNKMFLYLLAGLAVAATDIPGQRAVLRDLPEAACMYPAGDYRVLAKKLEYWQSNREALDCAKRAALEAARQVWNWERESEKLVTAIGAALRSTRPVRARARGIPAWSHGA